jgi:excisionase family DNA binding protein
MVGMRNPSSPRTLVHRTRQPLAVERQTYSIDEAAHLLGISRTSAYECVRDGSLPALHFRKRVVVTRATIDALLAQAGPSELTDIEPATADRGS